MHLPRNQRSHTGRNTASDCSTCQEKTRVQLIQYAAATCWLYCFLSSILLSSLRHFQSELHSVVPDTIYVLLHFFFFPFLKDNAWINCTTELLKKSLSSISRTVARSEEWQLNLPEHSLITAPTKMGFKAEDDWQGVLSPALPEDRKTHHLVPTRSSLNQATTRRLLSRNLQMPSPVNCMWACRTWSQSWISREHQRWLKGHRPYWGNKVESPQLHGGLTQQHSPSGDDARLKTVAGIREWRLKCNKWH